MQYQYGSSGMVETNAAWGTYVNYANCGWQLCSWPIPSSIRCASGRGGGAVVVACLVDVCDDWD